MQEKCDADQREVDTKVRGKLLANAAVAEVRCQFMCQVDKARLAVEKFQVEQDALQSLCKVRMKLGMSVSLFLFIA